MSNERKATRDEVLAALIRDGRKLRDSVLGARHAGVNLLVPFYDDIEPHEFPLTDTVFGVSLPLHMTEHEILPAAMHRKYSTYDRESDYGQVPSYKRAMTYVADDLSFCFYVFDTCVVEVNQYGQMSEVISFDALDKLAEADRKQRKAESILEKMLHEIHASAIGFPTPTAVSEAYDFLLESQKERRASK